MFPRSGRQRRQDVYKRQGQDGEAMIENLQPGTYRVVEVDGDKEHYNLDASEQTIELARDQAEIPTLIFQNTIKKHFGIYKKMCIRDRE